MDLNAWVTDDSWNVGRSADERVFLDTMASLCRDPDRRPPFDAWTFYPQLVITLSIVDVVRKGVLRTLRVDYDGKSLTAGNDRSHQIDPDLDEMDPDYTELGKHGHPEVLARIAFDWFRDQARRPIDRQEWDGPSQMWLLWVLADDDRPLVAQYLGRPNRPADRVIRLDPTVL